MGLYELLKMKKLGIFTVHGFLSVLLLWVILLPERYEQALITLNYTKIEIGIVIILLLLTYTVITKNRFTFEAAGFTILSVIYVGIGFYYFIETRDAGLVYIFTHYS